MFGLRLSLVKNIFSRLPLAAGQVNPSEQRIIDCVSGFVNLFPFGSFPCFGNAADKFYEAVAVPLGWDGGYL